MPWRVFSNHAAYFPFRFFLSVTFFRFAFCILHLDPCGGFFQNPVVAALFQGEGEFLAAGADDLAVHQDMDEVGHDVIEEPLVMSDDESGVVRAAQFVDTGGDDFEGVMSRPESVSSRMASLGLRTAIWEISLRFFSPPEKPSLTGRLSRAGSRWRILLRSLTSLRDLTAARRPGRGTCGIR